MALGLGLFFFSLKVKACYLRFYGFFRNGSSLFSVYCDFCEHFVGHLFVSFSPPCSSVLNTVIFLNGS